MIRDGSARRDSGVKWRWAPCLGRTARRSLDYSQRGMALGARTAATAVSVLAEYSAAGGAVFPPSPILRFAGTRCAVSEDIMALALRTVLWFVVLLAPGGLLLLPFLALNEIKNARKSDTADVH